MGILDKTLQTMTQQDIVQLVQQQIALNVPAIPAGLLTLSNADMPVLHPPVVSDGQVLMWDASTGQYVSQGIASISGQITTTQITPGSITAPLLAANLVLASTIIAGDPTAAHLELGLSSSGDGSSGLSAFAGDAVTKTFSIDDSTGSAYMKGRLDFGTASRLTVTDTVVLAKQSTATYVVPARVQNVNIALSGTNLSSASPAWDSPTTTGSLLVLVVTSRCHTTNTPVAPDTPSGWTLAANTTQGHLRHTVFHRLPAPATSGAQAVTWSGTSHVDATCIQMFEITGVASVDVTAATTVATGNSTAPLSVTTGVLAQAGEYLMSTAGFNDTQSGVSSPSGGFYNYSRGTAQTYSTGPPIVLENVFQAVADLVTTATTAGQCGYTLGTAVDWIISVITYKAATAGTVATPDAGTSLLYAGSDGGSHSKLHEVADDGVGGSLVLGPVSTRWRMEYNAQTLSIPSTGANTGGSLSVTITGLVAGDLVLWMGVGTTTSPFIVSTQSLVTVTDTVTLNYHNTNDSSSALASQTHYFLVIHRT